MLLTALVTAFLGYINAFWYAQPTVRFYLFTRTNPVVGQCMGCNPSINTNFDPSKRTIILIHGLGQNATSDYNRDLKNAFITQGDYNIIVVDYSQAAAGCKLSQYTAYSVGCVVGKFIDNLNTQNSIIYMVGYDLGAHVAAYGSRTSARGRVERIVGLDPLSLGINFNDPNSRLNPTDANYVEVFHTNSGTYGIGAPIGKTDYYVNQGVNQPGCATPQCSHYKSVTVYLAAINNPSQISVQTCQVNSPLVFSCSGDFTEYSETAADGVYNLKFEE